MDDFMFECLQGIYIVYGYVGEERAARQAVLWEQMPGVVQMQVALFCDEELAHHQNLSDLIYQHPFT